MRTLISYIRTLNEARSEGTMKVGGPESGLKWLKVSRNDFTNWFNLDATEFSDDELIKILKTSEVQLEEPFHVYDPDDNELAVDTDLGMKLWSGQLTARDFVFQLSDDLYDFEQDDLDYFVQSVKDTVETVVMEVIETAAVEAGMKYWWEK